MPLAITLRFDRVSASAIQDMWKTLADEGIDADRYQVGYAPHITLAVYPDDVRVEPIRTALEKVAADWEALPVALSGFGIFPGPPHVLWAAPLVTRELLSRHNAVHAALPGLPSHAHYSPDAWVPHVTLSDGLSDPGRALSVLMTRWRPIGGTLNQLDLLRFRPVEILYSRDFTG